MSAKGSEFPWEGRVSARRRLSSRIPVVTFAPRLDHHGKVVTPSGTIFISLR